MPVQISAPRGTVMVSTQPLHQDNFASYGTVIENPDHALIPSDRIPKQYLPHNAVHANQGSALKYLDVTHMVDRYPSAPSGRAGHAVVNMFVCAPRTLIPSHDSGIDGHFQVNILERHPYTTQTFIPLGISPAEQDEARYLVIVAPTLPPTKADEGLPVPRDSPGRGLPDLSRVHAFVAKGSQAVTYGGGTWHAPMVVVGKRPVTFVVVQTANGVGLEDCQEAQWDTDHDSNLLVAVPRVQKRVPSKL
ncbi:ureidoglycolate hydrolase [Phlyctema vagabunda]|uniref:Ureidoglycolate hydrolase n=1 Tax=Phlyctema vagabunda TaxID=108571 RepID=A0ABR4PN66_9HELO